MKAIHTLHTLSLICLLSGCSKVVDSTTSNPFPLMSPRGISNSDCLGYESKLDFTERAYVPLSEDELTAWISDWQFSADSISELTRDQLLITDAPLQETLDYRTAQEDVDYLFRLLRHGYAAYGYFNQLGQMDQAYDNLKREIDVQQLPIARTWLNERIRAQLSFIQDGHFSIEGQSFFQHMNYWYWDDIEFIKEGNTYWFNDSRGRFKVETINGNTPELVMKLSLSASSDIVWRLGTLSAQQPEDFELIAKNSNGSETRRMVGEWKDGSTSIPVESDEVFYSLTHNNEIPTITIRHFLPENQAENEQLEQFVEDATELQDAPIIIIDIRGHQGGYGNWAYQWVKSFTGFWRGPEPTMLQASLLTRTTIIGRMNYSQDAWALKDKMMYEDNLEMLEAGIAPRGWTRGYIPDIQPIGGNPNQWIVVLMDERTASAGELFVDYLRQIDSHVIFVGTNTQGIRMVANNGKYKLPNSGLSIYFGSKVNVSPDLTPFEGIGYKPDLWIPSDQALDAVINALVNNCLVD